jgi:hypothetical protein
MTAERDDAGLKRFRPPWQESLISVLGGEKRGCSIRPPRRMPRIHVGERVDVCMAGHPGGSVTAERDDAGL